jgi:hypothetical protein
MENLLEKKMWKINGFLALLVELAAMALSVYCFVLSAPLVEESGPDLRFWSSLILFSLACISMGGFFIVQPNESKVFTFFGSYSGTVRDAGFGWTNPFAKKKELSLRVRNFATDTLKVNDARLSHLAYAPEIAQAMLRRQQAGAVIAARRLIVDGAVGMVKMALTDLEEQGVVKLDNERRASMVNNLLVALVSESEARPVINTGTLYA